MTRDQLRAAMPTVAKIIDEYRPWLKKVVFCAENGHVIDRREPEPYVFDIPRDYFPCRPMQGKDRNAQR